jgi:hypothetical protein
MRALWRKDVRLAMLVDAVDDDERLPLEPTRLGAWTAKAQGAYLHSRYDPEAEAERFAQAVPMSDKFCFIVPGIGLGYHLRALAKRLRGHAFILCIEPSAVAISTALSCLDLSTLILDDQLVIVATSDKAYLHERLNLFGPIMFLGIQIVRPLVRAGAEYAAILKAVAEFVEYSRIGLTTLTHNSRIGTKNIAMNLAACVTTPPINVLKGRFRGNPAIVISAGPSLGRNIDQLADLKGKAVLIAVQTVLRPLARLGISPDFVASIDYHEMSAKYFQDVGGLEDVHLVVDLKATWYVADAHTGPMSFLDTGWARLLSDHIGARDGLKDGATVAHTALYLAIYMGCDPIIFVGQDLAYTGFVEHARGVEIHRQHWRRETNRFCSIEDQEWEAIARNRQWLRKVPAAQGGYLYSNVQLSTYLERFETDIAGLSNRVLNCTEGGAHIRGTKVLSLREASQRHCTEPIDPKRFAYRDAIQWRDTSRLQIVGSEIAKRIDELEALLEVCDDLLGLLAELEALIGDPVAFNRLLVRVDEIRVKLGGMYGAEPGYPRALALIDGANQLGKFRQYAADRRLQAADVDDTEYARRQIQRDTEFITGLRDGAREMVDTLRGSVERFAEVA